MDISSNFAASRTPYHTPQSSPESDYQTPSQSGTDKAVNFSKRLIEWQQTPHAKKQENDKSLIEQLDVIYEMLDEFLQLPEDIILTLSHEHRVIFKWMIDLFSPHLEEFKHRAFIYQELYLQLEERLEQPAFKNYFSNTNL